MIPTCGACMYALELNGLGVFPKAMPKKRDGYVQPETPLQTDSEGKPRVHEGRLVTQPARLTAQAESCHWCGFVRL